MKVINTQPPEIQAPGVPSPLEQGLIGNGVDHDVVRGIGEVLTTFAKRQETVPLSLKAGIDQARADRAEMALEEAHIDYATGLMGPKKFWEDMDSYVRRLNDMSPDRRSIAILNCDLSGLKRVNDTYGRAMGDKYLKETAVALAKFTRTDDKWYRLGSRSDEISGVLHGVKPDKDGNYVQSIEAIEQKLVSEVRQHLIDAGLPVDELHLGILMAGDMLKVGETSQELFERVDDRLREKKNKAKENLPDKLKPDDRL